MAKRVRAEVSPSERRVMVRLLEGFRSLRVQIQGAGLSLAPGTLSPATKQRKEDGWQLDLPGDGAKLGSGVPSTGPGNGAWSRFASVIW